MSASADINRMSAIVDIGTVSPYADIVIVRTPRALGAAVRDARLERGWTQAELAERVGTSRQWIVALERGKATAEVGMVLRAIAALGAALDLMPAPSAEGVIDLDELLDDTP